MVRFSIITPVYNGEKFIEKNIIKLQAQTYKNFEHIVIDGASEDKTVEILEKYKDRLTYISEKDSGQSNAINKGLRMAIGDVITWLNADDFLYDNTVLEKVAKYFEDPSITIIEGRCKLVDLSTGEEKIIPQPEVTERSLTRWWVEYSVPPQPSIFFRKSLVDQYGLIDESLHYCMDHELWLRFLSNGEKFTQIPDILSIYQVHPESKTGTSIPKFVKEHNKVAKRYWGKVWQPRFYKHLAEHIYASFKFRKVFKYLKE
ncbi:putative glycosyltransferase EpsJ [Patescibacteria group bacterium]|jgi:glycosyltransferase involved in cell wall biosynthesis|nr:putative glycosyltransferase EpsJ [Patescibacteria group bacterium]